MTDVAAPCGLLVIDKPRGPTSMDVCRIVRGKLRAGGAPKRIKVGHGGTLDPLATGVLIVLVGRATKLCDQIMQSSKRYHAVVDLSAFTTTDDAEGEREDVGVEEPPSRERIEGQLAAFVGEIEQAPPAFSAIKVEGRRAYKLARAGAAPELPARRVRIDGIEIVEYDFPRLALDVRCGKGVYIRSLARDIGKRLGTGGTLASLCRTEVGRWTLADAVALRDLPDPLRAVDLMAAPG
ncbi:MAG: tRNA pseudouridine(55) synthase TruB [Phycisphaerales bacterium JB037]